MRLATILILILALGAACARRVRIDSNLGGVKGGEVNIMNPEKKYPPTPPGEQVRLLMPNDSAQGQRLTAPIASYYKGVRAAKGCTYQEAISNIVAVGRQLGAKTVYIHRIWVPDDKSSCYRMSAIYYR